MNAVDTNVLLYAYDTRDPRKRDIAIKLVAELADGVLLWQVACEFIAASRKLARFGFTLDEAWARLRDLRRMFPVVPPRVAALDRARELSIQHQLQIWDAMLYAACLESGVSTLYSEDVPGARIEGLRIVNPFAA